MDASQKNTYRKTLAQDVLTEDDLDGVKSLIKISVRDLQLC